MNDEEFQEFDSPESEREFWAYWGIPEWSEADQLLFEQSYNQYRITGQP